MKNKLGKGNTALWSILVVLVIIAIGGFFLFSSQSNFGTDADVSRTACAIDTTFTPTILESIDVGNNLSNLIYKASVNGDSYSTFTAGSTTFSPGDTVKLFVSKGDYIDFETETVNLKCGVNRKDFKMAPTDDGTFAVFNDDGNKVSDLATGGATNQSSSATTIVQRVQMKAPADKSTGDLVVVVEATNTTCVDDISFSGEGAQTTDVPEFYSVSSSGSIVKAFRIPALIDDGGSDAVRDYYVSFAPESGQTIGEGSGLSVYMTAYSEQAFIDTDGGLVVGAENSQGTNKYEDDWDYDWKIK